jgi:DNA-binding NtrC family response regulator
MTARILVVDDERNIRLMLEQVLNLAGYEMVGAASGEEAVSRAAEGDIDAVLLDVKLGGMDGLETLSHLRRRAPDTTIIMMSGHGTIETAVAAVRKGAFDFLEKPLGRDKTLLTLENALRLRALTLENRSLRAATGGEELLGESPPMRALRDRIAQVAPTEARVLIEGESGVGKELVARALHRQSRRAQRPLLTLNCAAIPAELIESELFGHVRGAFTGATAGRAGVFEAADGGTLLLDEIGDMPPSMQAKLLRVLESGESIRVGTHQATRVDVRVLSATHRDLAAAVVAGEFREDLYHRMNVVPLRVPPLRERPEDIPILAQHFLRIHCERHHLPARRFGAEALLTLGRHRWPGNVRELRNLVERLAILAPSEVLNADYVAAELPSEGGGGVSSMSLRSLVADLERKAILAALRGAGGNVSEAARRLDLERSHLYKKARQLGLDLSER